MRPSRLLKELETGAKKRLFERLKRYGKDTLNPEGLLHTLMDSGVPVLERIQVANHYWGRESVVEITPENVHKILESLEALLRLLVEISE